MASFLTSKNFFFSPFFSSFFSIVLPRLQIIKIRCAKSAPDLFLQGKSTFYRLILCHFKYWPC
jgi:hypothetical protein